MEAFRKNSINYGLYLGLFLILATTIIYAIDLSLFTTMWVGCINLVIITAFGILATVKSKKLGGGFLTFRAAFTSFFITVLIGLLISIVYTMLLFNYIDPEAKAIMTENVIKVTVEMMRKLGAKAADINKIVSDMQKTDSFGTFAQLQGLAFNLVIYSIIGLICAAVIKRERPQSL